MLLTVDNTTQPITEWAADFGIPVALIRSRLKRGWSEERAVTEPMIVRRGEELPANAMLDLPRPPRPIVPSPFIAPRLELAKVITFPRKPRPTRPPRLYTFNSLSLSIGEWAQRVGISSQAMHARLRKGGSLEVAFTAGDRRHLGHSHGGPRKAA